MLPLLYCSFDVRAVNRLWVQLGDGRPDGDVKCAIGTERAHSRYLVPSELFKGCLTAAGQSGPGLTTLGTQAWSYLINFQIISKLKLSWIILECYVTLWLCLCGGEDTRQSTGCLLKAQSDMSVSGSGRTLRIRSMAGTLIIQLCNRLFSSVLAAFLLFVLTCCVSGLPVHCSIICSCKWWLVNAGENLIN